MSAGSKLDSDSSLFWASGISLVLVVIKGIAYGSTGSLLVLGSLFDSAGDTLISAINGRMQKVAVAGPDREHPYGHGGFEVVTSLAQGTILSVLGLVLILQSLDHLIFRDEQVIKSENMAFGVGVLVFAALSGLFIQFFLGLREKKLHANKERSLSLKADRAHYLTDFWVNGLSAAGLCFVWITGWQFLDAIFGVVAGLFILRTAGPVFWASLRDILHYEADPEIQQTIIETGKAVDQRIVGIHRLRTRHYGPTIIADFHMKLPSGMILEDAHNIGDSVVAALKNKIPHLDAIIHLDPDSEPDDDLW